MDINNVINDTYFDIVYQDQDLVVVNKPAGVVVNDAKSVRGLTIQEWFTNQLLDLPEVPKEIWQNQIPADFSDEYGSPEEIFALRGGIVHRLDKETSGAMLLAKHPGSLIGLLRQFQERTVQKRYTCLVHGFLAQQEGLIDFPLGRSPHNRHRFTVLPEGRPSQTEFKVEFEISKEQVLKGVQTLIEDQDYNWIQIKEDAEKLYEGFSFVSCWPKTGRTHQIRVHLTYLNHPLIADELYTGRKRCRLDQTWCPRQFLHAAEITFIHPSTQQEMTVRAPLEKQFQHIINAFK